MPSPFAKVLIDIAVGHLIPNKYAWVSEYEAGPFHVETTASAGKGGDTFNALCGAFGSFMAHRTAKQVLSSEKCRTCQELSTTGIQDVADLSTGIAPVIDGLTVGDEGVGGTVEGHGEGIALDPRGYTEERATTLKAGVSSYGRTLNSELCPMRKVSGCSPERDREVGTQAPPTDSQISLIERLIPKTLPDADFCHCGQPAVHTCPCGKDVCVAHLYDGEGQHVEAQGFCADCVDLIQSEQRGIERCGRAEAR